MTDTAVVPRRTLYELTGDFQALAELLESTDGELTPELEAWWDANQAALTKKSDGIGAVVRILESQAWECHQEAGRLTKRAQSAERNVASLKRLCDRSMQAMGTDKLEGTLFTIARVRNGGKPRLAVLVPAEALPAEYVDVTVTRTPNQERLRAWLATEGGGYITMPGGSMTQVAKLEEPTYSVRVR